MRKQWADCLAICQSTSTLCQFSAYGRPSGPRPAEVESGLALVSVS